MEFGHHREYDVLTLEKQFSQWCMRKEWLDMCALLGFYAAQIGSLHEIMAVWRENCNTSATSTSLLLQSYILSYFKGQYLLLCVKFQRQYVKKIKRKKLHKNP
jgi:hypothetical protein